MICEETVTKSNLEVEKLQAELHKLVGHQNTSQKIQVSTLILSYSQMTFNFIASSSNQKGKQCIETRNCEVENTTEKEIARRRATQSTQCCQLKLQLCCC